MWLLTSGTLLNGLCAWTIESVCVCVRTLQEPGLTVFWQSALMSCSSWLSNFSRDGWRVMVSLLRVKGSILSSWGLSRASPGDSTDTNISAMPWHLHDYISTLVSKIFFSPGLFFSPESLFCWDYCGGKNNWKSPSSSKNVWNELLKYFSPYSYFCDPFAEFPDISHHPQKIYLGIP